MSDHCREMRPLLGAAALGRLEPAEDIALRAHLDGCASCRAELRELTSVAAALPSADASRLEHLAEPPRELADRVLDRVARERSAARTRRIRRAGIAAAVVAVAAAIALAVFVSVDTPPPGTRVSFPAHDGVTAEATLHARDTGTEVTFHVTGLTDGEWYWLWLTGDDGKRVTAGTFRGVPATSDIVMTAALPLDEARRIWLTDEDDRIILDRRF